MLETETGQSQPEILADLRHDPPDYADADQRLGAVVAAMGRPGDVGNPAAARANLHGILAQSRYSGLHAQDSLWNRFWNWVATQIFGWLATVGLGSLPAWVPWTLLAVAGLMTAGVALLLARTGWTKAGQALEAVREAMPRLDVDRFLEADEAAARGDHAAALRALVAGVATQVSGRPYWETSPLTVRELFRTTTERDRLQPLLQAFELAVYGLRPVTEAEYRHARELAEPFRARAQQSEEAA